MYTVQRNHCCDLIVCVGNKPEPGYWVVFTGSWYDCNRLSRGEDL